MTSLRKPNFAKALARNGAEPDEEVPRPDAWSGSPERLLQGLTVFAVTVALLYLTLRWFTGDGDD